MPVQALAGELFTDPGARAWLYGSAMHGDVARRQLGQRDSSRLFLNLLGHAVGWPSPEGGAGRLAGALVGIPGEPRRRRSAPTPRSSGSQPTAAARAA